MMLKLELPKGLLGAMPARCTLPCHPLGTLASTLWLWCAAGLPRPPRRHPPLQRWLGALQRRSQIFISQNWLVHFS